MTIPAEGPSPARIIAPLLRIPHSQRVFRLPPSALKRSYGMTGEIVDQLVGLGLPHLATPEGPLFDEDDIASVSLYLRLPSARRGVMTYWVRALRRLGTAGAPPVHRVDVAAGCPDPGHEGACRYTLALGDGPPRAQDARRDATGPLASLAVRAAGRPRELPAAVREVLRVFQDIDYYLLPGTAAAEPGLMQRTGIGDCILMARALVDEALGRGMDARVASGLIVAVPFSSAHTWAEFQVAGEWLPVDPLLPKALSAWGVPGAADWPPTLSPVGLFHRLGGQPRQLVTHGGEPCGFSLRTREEAA
ncbi:transglutaminase domain-containing protein [Kitasatospora sp. NPDC048239]|uniref:transglutaminase domain-containing protein n=1 Tax=Kitasatospora sp. NPDC048239 TaxID=3364046 RepID=UPI00371D55FD